MNRWSWLSHITVTDIRTNTDDFDETRWLISKATEEALADGVKRHDVMHRWRRMPDVSQPLIVGADTSSSRFP